MSFTLAVVGTNLSCEQVIETITRSRYDTTSCSVTSVLKISPYINVRNPWNSEAHGFSMRGFCRFEVPHIAEEEPMLTRGVRWPCVETKHG